MTQKLGFPGTGSGSVWLQHGPHPAVGSAPGVAPRSTIAKDPLWQRVGGGVSGGRVCGGGEPGRRARLLSGWSSGFRCGVEGVGGEAWEIDWSQAVGACEGGMGAVGMKIYTFPTGVAGLLEASNFGGTPLGGVLALGCF